jgi:hypothetical protein
VRSDGDGVTARELAELIYKGKHDKVLETHGNALQEMISQFMSSSSDRSKFLGLLQGIIQRLAVIERNGYRSPQEADYIVEEQNELELRSITASQSDDLNSKKKTKKKKKKAVLPQGEDNNDASEFAEVSPDRELKDDACEDPLVEALRNMGFTLNQIHAAAKACGGLERATADDLVAWIFGQQSADPTPPIPSKDSSQKETDLKPRHEQLKVEAKAKAEAILKEEAARRQEEARIAAQRLAAKREETRRRNREWNNREQARQLEEAQAKLSTQAMMRAKVEAQAALNATPASLLLPQSDELAEKPAIVLPPPPPPLVPKPAPVGPPAVTNYVQPTRILKNPALMRPSIARPVSVPTSPVPATTEKRNTEPISASFVGGESMSLYGDYPEDATVSSYGSGVRSLGSMPKQFQMLNQQPVITQPMPQPFLPPGLRYSSSEVNMNTSAPSYLSDSSQLGDLRATAKSFTPTSFRQNAAHGTNLHNMSGPTPIYPSAPSQVPLVRGAEISPAFDSSLSPMRMQSESTVAPLRDPVSSLFTGPMIRPPGNPLLLTTPLQRGMANSFDRGTASTTSTIDSHAPLSSTSSVTRVSSYGEPPLPTPHAFGINPKLSSAPGGGPSIMDSLELAPSATRFGSGFGAPDIGGATIWGSGDNGGGNSAAPVGRSVAGLPPLFLPGGSNTHGVIGGSDNRPSNLRESNMAGVWEPSLGSSANTGGSSIW